MKRGIALVVLFFVINSVGAQSSKLEIVDVRERMPDVQIDAPYSGVSNFLGQKLYASDARTAYGGLDALGWLARVRAGLNEEGYDIKIWDFYRPRSVQWIMWNELPDPRFVADPRGGSNHNRAAAVDVTLVDALTGVELDMGTAFDDFSDAAAHAYLGLPDEVFARRTRLRLVMDAWGFSSYFAEWWHYTYGPTSVNGQLTDWQMK